MFTPVDQRSSAIVQTSRAEKTSPIGLVFRAVRVLFQVQLVKIVGRYQQFRAVKLAVKRLLEGKTPRERSGIIWHTQGSGKSLTMMFMVREMYRTLDPLIARSRSTSNVVSALAALRSEIRPLNAFTAAAI